MWNNYNTKCEIGACMAMQPRTWNTSILFSKWASHFVKYIQIKGGNIYLKNRHLLMLDGYNSYVIIDDPTMVGGPLDLVVWVLQSPLGRYHVRYFQGTSGLLASSIVWHCSIHLRKGKVVLSQSPLVRWASSHWHYERPLHSRWPLEGAKISIYPIAHL